MNRALQWITAPLLSTITTVDEELKEFPFKVAFSSLLSRKSRCPVKSVLTNSYEGTKHSSGCPERPTSTEQQFYYADVLDARSHFPVVGASLYLLKLVSQNHAEQNLTSTIND